VRNPAPREPKHAKHFHKKETAMNDRRLKMNPSLHLAMRADALALADDPAARLGLWAYLATVRVIVRGGQAAQTKTIRGLLCARNHREAQGRATAVAAEKARQLGHVIDIDLTRLW
jgi:hypothetical protein